MSPEPDAPAKLIDFGPLGFAPVPRAVPLVSGAKSDETKRHGSLTFWSGSSCHTMYSDSATSVQHGYDVNLPRSCIFCENKSRTPIVQGIRNRPCSRVQALRATSNRRSIGGMRRARRRRPSRDFKRQLEVTASWVLTASWVSAS